MEQTAGVLMLQALKLIEYKCSASEVPFSIEMDPFSNYTTSNTYFIFMIYHVIFPTNVDFLYIHI